MYMLRTKETGGEHMALFGKKEEKNYIVFDPTGEAIAVCLTKEVKQIANVQPRATYVECTSYEYFKFKEHNQLPADIDGRKHLSAKEIK